MRATIVNCFDTYEDRVDLIYDYLISKGYETTVIQSDFRHFKKIKRLDKKADFVFVKSRPYYKNLSFDRLFSHYKFSIDSFKIVKKHNPDLLYVMIPPNSLAKMATKYKKENKNVKLVFDLIDLWPETMPINRVKLLPPFLYWKNLRNVNLKYADLVITECDLYQTVLNKSLDVQKTETVYLAHKGIEVVSEPNLSAEKIHLAYLGSINNIIDISMIENIVKKINDLKPVVFHIIGDGENKVKLINSIMATGSMVKDHGRVYCSIEKQKIFDECHFGLNIMKDNVCVGLTMKSIDYLQHGLPIINNIKADTKDIVEIYEVGVNVNDLNLDKVAKKIVLMEQAQLLRMRNNSLKTFEKLFSLNSFNERLNNVLHLIQKK